MNSFILQLPSLLGKVLLMCIFGAKIQSLKVDIARS